MYGHRVHVWVCRFQFKTDEEGFSSLPSGRLCVRVQPCASVCVLNWIEQVARRHPNTPARQMANCATCISPRTSRTDPVITPADQPPHSRTHRITTRTPGSAQCQDICGVNVNALAIVWEEQSKSGSERLKPSVASY